MKDFRVWRIRSTSFPGLNLADHPDPLGQIGWIDTKRIAARDEEANRTRYRAVVTENGKTFCHYTPVILPFIRAGSAKVPKSDWPDHEREKAIDSVYSFFPEKNPRFFFPLPASV